MSRSAQKDRTDAFICTESKQGFIVCVIKLIIFVVKVVIMITLTKNLIIIFKKSKAAVPSVGF